MSSENTNDALQLDESINRTDYVFEQMHHLKPEPKYIYIHHLLFAFTSFERNPF